MFAEFKSPDHFVYVHYKTHSVEVAVMDSLSANDAIKYRNLWSLSEQVRQVSLRGATGKIIKSFIFAEVGPVVKMVRPIHEVKKS